MYDNRYKIMKKQTGKAIYFARCQRSALSNRLKWLLVVALAFCTLVTGCISIPGENWIVSYRGPMEVAGQMGGCAIPAPGHVKPNQPAPKGKTAASDAKPHGLDTTEFSFATWNIHKGKAEGWVDDFDTLSRGTDILILQEAYLTDKLKQTLALEYHQWDLAAAYTYQKVEAGVLTASKVATNQICTLKDKEPITRIPKSILITRYPILGTNQELLVANIHAINFTMGYKAFQKQCDRLQDLLARHRGPMIVSGDFNTWNQGRMSRITAMTDSLHLAAVPFKDNSQSKFLGQYVDHVYYRGLEMKAATSMAVATSDHNPLKVVFQVSRESDQDS